MPTSAGSRLGMDEATDAGSGSADPLVSSITREEEEALLAEADVGPSDFIYPEEPPTFDLLAMQLEDENHRKQMEARLSAFASECAEMRELMTHGATPGAEAASSEDDDAGRAEREQQMNEAIRRARAQLDEWVPNIDELCGPVHADDIQTDSRSAFLTDVSTLLSTDPLGREHPMIDSSAKDEVERVERQQQRHEVMADLAARDAERRRLIADLMGAAESASRAADPAAVPPPPPPAAQLPAASTTCHAPSPVREASAPATCCPGTVGSALRHERISPRKSPIGASSAPHGGAGQESGGPICNSAHGHHSCVPPSARSGSSAGISSAGISSAASCLAVMQPNEPIDSAHGVTASSSQSSSSRGSSRPLTPELSFGALRGTNGVLVSGGGLGRGNRPGSGRLAASRAPGGGSVLGSLGRLSHQTPPPHPSLLLPSQGSMGSLMPIGCNASIAKSCRPTSASRPGSSHQLMPTFSERDAGAQSSKAAADLISSRRLRERRVTSR